MDTRLPGETAAAAGVLELNNVERVALATELRKYADYREGDLSFDLGERAAELHTDPTYAYSQDAIESELRREEEVMRRINQKFAVAASPYRDLADQVEATGRLNLADSDIRRDVTEVIDNTGWEVGEDPFRLPPEPMRRVVEAVQAPRLTSPAQRDAPVSSRAVEADHQPPLSERVKPAPKVTAEGLAAQLDGAARARAATPSAPAVDRTRGVSR